MEEGPSGSRNDGRDIVFKNKSYIARDPSGALLRKHETAKMVPQIPQPKKKASRGMDIGKMFNVGVRKGKPPKERNRITSEQKKKGVLNIRFNVIELLH